MYHEELVKKVLWLRDEERIYFEYRDKGIGRTETSLSRAELDIELRHSERKIKRAELEVEAEILKAAELIRSAGGIAT